MFHDPIRIPAIIELSVLAIALIVVSILRVRQQRERARNRALTEKRRSEKTGM
ncbi:hypothetical protein QF000_004219 [Paraburkholderia atlantica]|nr:hypothetical protein [Paraburkholderia atlantica]